MSISLVITTHGEARDLPGILNSIENQREYGVGKHSKTGHDFKYAAGGLLEYPRETIVTWDGAITRNLTPQVPRGLEQWKKQSPVKIMEFPTVNGGFIENEAQGAPGHHTRSPGIEAATGDFIVLTNSDNYFCSGWLSSIKPHLENPKIGMVYYDVTSNLWAWTNGGGSKLKRGCIDLSAVVVRSDIAKKVLFPWRDYEADWTYISKCGELCSRKGLKIVYVKECLATHN